MNIIMLHRGPDQGQKELDHTIETTLQIVGQCLYHAC